MNFRKYIFLIFVLLFCSQVLAQVDTAWVRRHNAGTALSLAVDDSGNVYVTGVSSNETFEDYGTIKYAPNGETLWVRYYDGTGNHSDGAKALVVDENGNVYVTGVSVGDGTSTDYATIKYAPNGDSLWVRRFNGPGNYIDEPSALAVDKNGSVYVIGYSMSSETRADYATIKYAPNGDALWVRFYNGPENSWDEPRAIAVDKSDNVYVTGFSGGDFVTIKYAPNGDTSWIRRYIGPANSYDKPSALAVDDSGNVYVTGYSYGDETVIDYATVKYAPNGDSLWVRYYNGLVNGLDAATALAVDGSGNVYVTGFSLGSETSFDFATVKYASNGDTLWVRRYNAPGQVRDFPYALVVDNTGNVYVTGVTDVSFYYTGTGDYATIKYSRNGDSLWFMRYNGLGNGSDEAKALAVDKNRNVYVTGNSSNGNGFDYATIKYFQCLAMPGDLDGDNAVIVPDILILVNYVFKEKQTLDPLCRADANGNGKIGIEDIVYLVNYLFRTGSGPVKSKQCCL